VIGGVTAPIFEEESHPVLRLRMAEVESPEQGEV
jgi:hypothetical protein